MKAVTASLLAVSVASLAPHSVACWWPGEALRSYFGGSDDTTVPPDTAAPYESNDVLHKTTFAPTDDMTTMPQTQETTVFSLELLMTTNGTDALQSGTQPLDHDSLGMATVVNSEATPETTETTAQLTTKGFVTTSSMPLYDPDENSVSVSAFNSEPFGNSMSDSIAQATTVTSESTAVTTSERTVTDTSAPSRTFLSGTAHNNTRTLANEVQLDATVSSSTVSQPITVPYVDDDSSALSNEVRPDATTNVTTVGQLTTAAYVDNRTSTLADEATTNMGATVLPSAASTDDNETSSALFPLTINDVVLVDQGTDEDASNLVAGTDDNATRTTLMTTSGADVPQSGSFPLEDDIMVSVTVANAEATPETMETTAQLTTKGFETTSSTPPFDLNENSVIAFNSGMFGNNMSAPVPDHSPPTATTEAVGSATFTQTSSEERQSTTEGNVVTTVDDLGYSTETTVLTTASMTATTLLHALVTRAGLEHTAVGSTSNNTSSPTVVVSSVTEPMTNSTTITTPTTQPAEETSQVMSSSTPTATTVPMISIVAEAAEETDPGTFSSTPTTTTVTMSSTAAEAAEEADHVTTSSTPTASTVTMPSTAAEAAEETGPVTFSSTPTTTAVTMSSIATEAEEETDHVTTLSTPTTSSVTMPSTAAEAAEETDHVASSSTPMATTVIMDTIAGEAAGETAHETSTPMTTTVTMRSIAAEATEETGQVTSSSASTASTVTMRFFTDEATEETGQVMSSTTPTATTVTMRHTATDSLAESTTQLNNASPSEDETHRETSSTEDLASTGYSLISPSTEPELQHKGAEDTTAATTTTATRRYKPVYVRRFTPWLITRSSPSSLAVTSSSSPTSSSVSPQPELDILNAREASTVESRPDNGHERLYQNNLALRSLPVTSKAVTKVPPSDTLVVPQSFFGSRNALFNRFGRPYCPGCDALLIKLPARFSIPRVPPYVYG